MELRLIKEPLLRSWISPLPSFLAPSIPPLWRATTTCPQLQLLMPRSPRYKSSKIHTTACQRVPSSSNAADVDFLNEEPEPRPKQPSRTPFPQNRRPDDVLGKQVDSLLDATFQTPSIAKRDPSKPADVSSATMIERAFRNNVRNREPDKSYREIARRMQFPSLNAAGAANATSYQTVAPRLVKRAKRTVRSSPSVGRTIEVIPDRGVDVGRALRNLDVACAINKVRQDLARQRFHERPGLKRKRLKSERWRKMFKASFRATVMRVQEMRRKGW